MSKKMASILIAYGVVLAGLGFLLHQTAPAFGKVTFIAGLAGGGLCLLWGIAALAGLKGRSWAVLTAIATALVLLSQTVPAWMGSGNEVAGAVTVRLLVTVMMLLAIGVLMHLLHGERPPEFYERGANHRADPFASGKEPQSRDTRSKR
jgi:hypothetical protein